MNKTVILVCEPNKNPETKTIESIAEIIKIVGMPMEVKSIGDKFVVYSSTAPDRKFNRNFFGYNVSGNLVVTRVVDGVPTSLSDSEIVAISSELMKPQIIDLN